MSIKDALAGGGALLMGAAMLLGVVMGDATRPATTVIDQLPMSGSSAFSVEAFCREQRTSVTPAPAPDAIAPVYQLFQPQESVIWNSATDSAVHYYFVNGEQRSEIVIVTQPAAACIEERAQ